MTTSNMEVVMGNDLAYTMLPPTLAITNGHLLYVCSVIQIYNKTFGLY